jgi:kumamolisin
VCCASGDDGSSDAPESERDGRPHVDFPASSPFALACGGTNLIADGSSIASEFVWNQHGATGGGVSNTFARPDYQQGANVPKSPKRKSGRGVPDVAGNAMPGYIVRTVDGTLEPISGTSGVAPLWAGLVALLNQKRASRSKPPVGFINPLIYAPAVAGTFRDIVQGNNDVEGLGKYQAGPGWDACTGLGSPDASMLIAALA